MLVNEFLEQSVERSPDKIALICRGRRLTYAEIDDFSNRLGNALVAKGLQRHERAAIFLEDSAESVISVFGILKSGGEFLIVNPQAKARKIEYILNDCQVKILVTDSRRFPVVSAVLDRCPTLETVLLIDTDKPNLPSGPTNSLDMSLYYPTLDGYPCDTTRKALYRCRFGLSHLHLRLNRQSQRGNADAPEHVHCRRLHH